MSLCNDCRLHCRARGCVGTSIIGVITSMSSRPLWMKGLLVESDSCWFVSWLAFGHVLGYNKSDHVHKTVVFVN